LEVAFCCNQKFRHGRRYSEVGVVAAAAAAAAVVVVVVAVVAAVGMVERKPSVKKEVFRWRL
jgi:hypothetical protein